MVTPSLNQCLINMIRRPLKGLKLEKGLIIKSYLTVI